MTDTKKYSIIEYVFLCASSLLTFLFSLSVKADIPQISPIGITLTAACVFIMAFFALKQRAAADRDAVRYAVRRAVFYILLQSAAVILLPLAVKHLPDNDYNDIIIGDTLSAISLIFCFAVHSAWRSSHRKIMNSKPLPVIPVLAFLLAAATAIIPFDIIEDVIPVPDKFVLPSPYQSGFVRNSPVINDNVLCYYVSAEKGNDDNDGLSEKNAFGSVAAAKTAIRSISEKTSDIAVFISEGNYEPNSFFFGLDDSGTQENEIIYIADGNVRTGDYALTLSVSKDAGYISVYGLEFSQNDAVEINGNNITVSGCAFAGCPVTVNGNNNKIINNEFSLTNGPALTDNGIGNNIRYNFFRNIHVISGGALTLNGTDSEITGNCFDEISLKDNCAGIFISDNAGGITADGNMILNMQGYAVSYPANDKTFDSFSFNYILNTVAPVINCRGAVRHTLKFNNNLIITDELAEHFPLNAVYTGNYTDKLFTDAFSGNYSLNPNAPVRDAFPGIPDIRLTTEPPVYDDLPEETSADGTSDITDTDTTDSSDNPDKNEGLLYG